MRGCRVQALDDALLIDNDEEILMADDEANEQVRVWQMMRPMIRCVYGR
jgi:hypothetical protein